MRESQYTSERSDTNPKEHLQTMHYRILWKSLNICAVLTMIIVMVPGCSVSTVHMPDVQRWKIPTSLPKANLKIPDVIVNEKSAHSYVVHGKRYWVKPVAVGYRQSGLASWYGKKFHGRLTANQEIYNMYQLSAAHKSLPLPSYIKVYNHSNGKSVTVRVNDRGPFVEGRIVDLSYAAAKQIGMDKAGLAPVTIEVIDTPGNQGYATFKVSNLSRPSPVSYIQVGSYTNIANAFNMMRILKQHHLTPRIKKVERNAITDMYSVHLGPFNTTRELETVGKLLDTKGFKEYRIFHK